MKPSVLIVAVGLAAAPCGHAAAQESGCANVQWRINAVYHVAGYCFHTAEAIQEWGNAGCRFQDPRELAFATPERAILNDLLALKRRMGCP